MRFLLTALSIVLFSSSIAFSQDITESKKLQGFDYLKQFEGSWKSVSKTADGQTAGEGKMSCKVLGSSWIVNEHKAEVGGMKFTAVQTLGYDSDKKEYVGVWIDSNLNHQWNYRGKLDSTCKKIVLNAEGPDWNDLSKTKKYRDMYEFKSANEIAATSQMQNDAGEWETFMTGTMTKVSKNETKTSAPKTQSSVAPFLMFEGNAQEVIDFYKSVFPGTKIESMTKYKEGEAKPGTIKIATVIIDGQKVLFTDSPIKHDFTFTPSFSFFVECENEEQQKMWFDKLSKGGKVMMPLNNYGFSKRFGWASDKFGVSWQLNLK